jgi:hypothetical protein
MNSIEMHSVLLDFNVASESRRQATSETGSQWTSKFIKNAFCILTEKKIDKSKRGVVSKTI